MNLAQNFAPAINPSLQHGRSTAGNSQCAPQQRVGEGRHSFGDLPLTDSAREATIGLAATLVERYMQLWEETGDFAYRGNADRARLSMEALIKGRSEAAKAQIAAGIEQRMAREPGMGGA